MSRRSDETHPSVHWKAVGQRLRELRGCDMTQEQMADFIGVTQGMVSKMERGTGEIGAEVLLRISRRYGVSIEWLLTGHEDW